MNYYVWIIAITVAVGSAVALFSYFREVNMSVAEARKKLFSMAIEVAILTAILLAVSYVIPRFFPSLKEFSFSRALGIALFSWLLSQAMTRYVHPKIRALLR